jgi:hypothetical protein
VGTHAPLLLSAMDIDFGNLMYVLFAIGFALLSGLGKWIKKRQGPQREDAKEGEDVYDVEPAELMEDFDRPPPRPVARPAPAEPGKTPVGTGRPIGRTVQRPPVRPPRARARPKYRPEPADVAGQRSSLSPLSPPRVPGRRGELVTAKARMPDRPVGKPAPRVPRPPPLIQIATALEAESRRAEPAKPLEPPPPAEPDVAGQRSSLSPPPSVSPPFPEAGRPLSPAGLRRAIVMAEILGPPVALRDVPGPQ